MVIGGIFSRDSFVERQVSVPKQRQQFRSLVAGGRYALLMPLSSRLSQHSSKTDHGIKYTTTQISRRLRGLKLRLGNIEDPEPNARVVYSRQCKGP